MGNVLNNLIGSLAILSASLYMWHVLYDDSLNFKSIRFYIICIMSMLLIILNYFYTFVFVRIISVCIIFALTNKLVYKRNNKETLVSTVLSELILSVADMSFGLIVIYLLRIDLESIPQFYGTLFANIYALVLSIFISNFKIVKKIYTFLMNFVNNIHQQKIISLSLLMIISLNLLLALIFFKLNTYHVFVINIVLILIYSYILVKNLETSSKNEVMQAENILLMENLHQYEDMVDRQRVDNHENKNQLLIIKNMINKKDKDVVKYIDTIVKDQKEDDEALYTKVKTIPSGGLQGIIYQKMLVMKDEKILFSLDVSRDVRKVDLDNFSMEDNYRLCKIIGVFLDNAIEESRNIDDKRIMISLYVDDDNLVVDISNKFNGKIELDRLDDEGYTTKSDGHGYGLSLVKKILSETDKFENERSIRKDIFKQTIKVKIKNT